MALNNVIIQQRAGSSGRALTGNDHHTGVMLYGNAPVVDGKWSPYTSDGVTIKAQKLFSEGEIATCGIVPYTDNASNECVLDISRGATGDKIKLTASIPEEGKSDDSSLVLIDYTQLSSDSTDTLLATSIVSYINSKTSSNGFSAQLADGDDSINGNALRDVGSGYAVGDTFTVDGGVTDATGIVTSVNRGASATAFTVVSGGTKYAVNDPITLTVAGATVAPQAQITSITPDGDGTAAIEILAVSGSGAITSWRIANGGSGYTEGNLVYPSSIGYRALFLITGVTGGGKITAMTPVDSGGGFYPTTIGLTSKTGVVTGVRIAYAGEGCTTGTKSTVWRPNRTVPPSATPSGLTIGISTVSASNTVASYSITGSGGGYTVGNDVATTATSGSGTGLTIDITSITPVYNILIKAPRKFGVYLNGKNYITKSITGAITCDITFNNKLGTASLFSVWDYQLREIFRMFPQVVLYVGIISSTSDRNEIVALQSYSKGLICQFAVYDSNTTEFNPSTSLSAPLQIQTALDSLAQTFPAVAVYCGDMSDVSDLSEMADQNANSAPNVECVISQDGNAKGAFLYKTCGYTIGNIGAKVATIAKSRVSSSDAQPVPQFNVSDGTENNIIAFANGQMYSSLSSNLISQLDSYRYTFLRNFGGELAGSYWTDNKTCIVSTSDYCFLNDVRVFQKATRILRNAYIPLLSSETIFNGDGTLKDTTIAYFKSQGENAITANMITGYGDSPLISGIELTIDPAQKVRATNNLTVVATIVANGIARNITVSIGYGTI